MAVAKCVTVSGRSRGQFSTYLQRREAVWPSFCAHAELEQWPAAGPLARKRRRALVERLLAHAKGHAGPAASTHRIAVARGPVLWRARRRRHRWSPRCPSRRVPARGRRRAGAGRRVPNRHTKEHTAGPRATHTQRHNARKRRLALLAAGARALVAPVAPARPATQLAAFDASQMEGAETFGFWDPFGFSKTSPEALTWYRAAELKHGRVAMVACMGFIAQSFPLTKMADVPLAKASLYPGLSTVDVTFGDLAAAGNPVEQFKLIPTLGLWQFAFVAGMIETHGEFQKPHYLRGGAIGRNTLIWDPVGQLIRGEPITDTLAEDVRAKKRERELANGRLAMIGAMGFSAHYMIEGSVPAVIGNY